MNIQVFDSDGTVIGSAANPNFVPALTFGSLGVLTPGPGAATLGDAGARVKIPVVQGQTYYLRVFGQLPSEGPSQVVNGYDVNIINTPTDAPTTLQLSRNVPAGVAGAPDTGDLPNTATNSDTGRSQLDDNTFDNTPTMFLRYDDANFLFDLPGNQVTDTPPSGPIQFQFNSSTTLVPTGAGNYRIALFDGGGGHTVDPNDPTFLGFAQQVNATTFPHLYTFTVGGAGAAGDILVDGLHHITARVQMIDPATPLQTGFGARSTSLDIRIDTAPPPVFFGLPTDNTDGLDPASNSGVPGQPGTFSDGITNVTVPSFFGTAEANSVIRLFIDANGNGVFDPGTDFQIGETVAVPLDGTNAFPNGQWTLRSTVDLNDPVRLAALGKDGLRTDFRDGRRFGRQFRS